MRALQPADPQVIGPYRLLGQLGAGGMGQVFLGLSAGGRLVAVKVIRAELAADPEFRARFRRELAAARKVSGVFTAAVVDADLDGPVPWLATAYVPGPSLAQAVAGYGPLPPASVLALAAGLAESLNAIHAAGVVHRDLKPSNVLLAADGPRVIDFGISRAVDLTSLTRSGLVMGSPGFMSPEQAEGYDTGPASDIFSLGAVLAFAATGDGPFGGGSTAALVYRIVHSPAALDRVPAEVRPVIERCLAKDPRQRPTAAGLLAAVRVGQPGANWLPPALTAALGQYAVPAAPGPAMAGTPLMMGPPGPAMAGTPPTWTPAGPGQAPTWTPGWTPPGDQAYYPARRKRRGLLWVAVAAVAVIAAAAIGAALLRSPGRQPAAASTGSSTSAAPATPSARATATTEAAALAGTWTGTYTCSQGLTGLRLTIAAGSNDQLTATFNFYAVASNPGVPSGSFAMTGSYSASGIVLNPGYWINEPPDYAMVGLTGGFPPGNQRVLQGQVGDVTGCTTFSVQKS